MTLQLSLGKWRQRNGGMAVISEEDESGLWKWRGKCYAGTLYEGWVS